MTSLEEYSNNYFRLLSENETDSEEISTLIVLLFRRLYAAYPEPTSELAEAFDGLDQGLAQQLIGWLRSEHFIKVQGPNVWLTFTGCETIRRTCRELPAYKSFFEDEAVPPPCRPTELVLAVLKTHFEGGRAGGR